MKVGESLSWFERSTLENLSKYLKLKTTIEKLGIEELYGDTVLFGATPLVLLSARSVEEIRSLAARLLPFVKTFEKGLNENTGKFELSGFYGDVAIIISGSPPESCTVEVEDVEEEIPASPARTEVHKRFVMKGDCDPLMEGENA